MDSQSSLRNAPGGSALRKQDSDEAMVPGDEVLPLTMSDDEEEATLEDKLESFRAKWRRELKEKRAPSHNQPEDEAFDYAMMKKDNEAEARYLFEQGVTLERSGKLYEAVACYRRATQLVPDIEFKMYKTERPSTNNANTAGQPANAPNADIAKEDTENGNVDDDDLIERFEKLTLDQDGNFYLCTPAAQQSHAHLNVLPYEVVLYIFKWAISSELDMRTIEQASLVSRGFYLACRDQELWRLACARVWGDCRASLNDLPSYGHCWRDMYISRPRLNLLGAYISRTTYVRHGESSFQDVDYRPCFLVEYYRYLRFFSDGTVLMLTTPDEPQASLPKLRLKKARNPNVLTGRYCLTGKNRVSAIFKRIHIDDEPLGARSRRGLRVAPSTTEQIFDVQVEIRDSRGRKNCQLIWTHYSVRFRRSNGQEALSTFDLTLNKFPPFWFSNVRSFASSSEEPLD